MGPRFYLTFSPGSFIRNDFISQARSFENEIPECIFEEQREELFLKFVRRMICWVPEERATASELLSDPWLDPRT